MANPPRPSLPPSAAWHRSGLDLLSRLDHTSRSHARFRVHSSLKGKSTPWHHPRRTRRTLNPTVLTKLLLAGAILSACTEQAPPAAFAPNLRLDSIVEAYGTPEESDVFFGLISDVEVAPDGTLFVLDKRAMRVVHLSREGEFLGAYGGEGEGPGEFLSPSRMAVVGNDELVVLDDETFRLNRYAITPSGLVYLDRTQLDFDVLDLCAAGEQLVVNGFKDGHALHLMSLDGTIERSFYGLPAVVDPTIGERWQEDLKDAIGIGWVSCALPGQVVYLSMWGASLRDYSLDGATQWDVPVEDHVSIRFRETETGGFGVDLTGDRQWFHRGMTVIPFDQDLVVTQFMAYGPGAGGRDDPATELRLFRPSDSAQVILSDTLPFIEHMEGGTAWGWRNLPYPQVVKMSVEIKREAQGR